MNYLSVENLTKSYGILQLFQNLSFGIEKGQKVALVARNGAGKSTLMRLLTGKDSPDSGTITYNREVRLGYLEQEHKLEDNKTILENIFSADNPRTRAISEYEIAIAHHDEKQLQHAHDLMDQTGAWDYEARAREVLGKLDIHDLEKIVGTLSGGQKRRIALAKVLIEEPDLVLLDEPTNHLDLDMIEWLEEFLSQSGMTIFMVTHDRYFLENITDEILELENHSIYRYKGNFSYYLEKKSERETLESTTRDKQYLRFKKELEWARTMPQARTTKSKSRMSRFEDLREEVRKRTRDEELDIEINISRLGSKIVEMHNVKKEFGEVKVLNGFDYVFRTKETIGLVGRNGTGKTTFLNLITKRIEPDSGKVVVGETIVFGYFSQNNTPIKEGLRLLETVREVADFIPLTKGKTITAAQMLERFMFPKNSHSTFVEKLSGGERKRLQLLLVLMKNPNFLILDEPTNDLDVFTLAALEEYLMQYPGCLMIVSHDRYFLDKLVDHVFVLDGHGHVRDILGSYSTFRKVMNEMEVTQNTKATQGVEKAKVEGTIAESVTLSPKEKTKLSFKEKFEFEKLENEIPKLETEEKMLEDRLTENVSDHNELLKISKRLGEVSSDLDSKSMRWIELSEYV
ncbi:MAG: ABC-F family ATP-binding cassette domain-containing protein [Flavobacteriales bacterium]|nr:ABC-F family ATP-binding cassette domain-containing protein [Flavobacteriales bacterium]